MKILLISPLPPPSGGIATWTKYYLNSSFSRNNEVILVNSAVKENRAKEFKKIKLIEEIKRSLEIFLKIKINVPKVEIAHINTSCGHFGVIRDYLCLKYLKIKGIKTIVHFHCNIPDMIIKRHQKFFLKKILNNSNVNLVLNKTSQEYLKINYQIESNLIPNFILEKDFLELSNLEIKKNGVKKILYTGHITEAKGCKEILEVAKKMPEFEFILAGKINENDFIKYTLKNVIFLGEISFEQIKKNLKEADLFLFLSHTEGFTVSLLEAMSSGLPIIATNVGANEDMIENKGGYIINIGDIKEVENKILKIKENEELRNKMTAFNIEKVKKNYLQNKVLEEIFRIYKETLSESK